ncbi:MAG: Sec-independent protein translocase protein TatB [Bdellovibrionales bacterium]
MFNIGFSELVIIGIIALVFIGPKELPEIARVVGRFLNELKRTTSDLTSTMMQSQDELRRELDDVKKTLDEPIIGYQPQQEEEPFSHEKVDGILPQGARPVTEDDKKTKGET